jgi:hypothetical protein
MSSYEVMNPLFIRPRRVGKTLNMDMIIGFAKKSCEILSLSNLADKEH